MPTTLRAGAPRALDRLRRRRDEQGAERGGEYDGGNSNAPTPQRSRPEGHLRYTLHLVWVSDWPSTAASSASDPDDYAGLGNPSIAWSARSISSSSSATSFSSPAK